jgi:hypothetical protein
VWYLSDGLNIKYDSKIIHVIMVEKISEKNHGSKEKTGESWMIRTVYFRLFFRDY